MQDLEEDGMRVEEEEYREPEPVPLCQCLLSDSSDNIPISARKQHILTTVTRTEEYLRERRIPELVRFMITKLLADLPNDPVMYTEKLLDDSMLFRSGLGLAPNIYERRHMEAVVKSFDPGNRGWLTETQVHRAFVSLGLPPPKKLDEKMPTEIVINLLMTVQEKELFCLLSAGSSFALTADNSASNSPSLSHV